MSRERVTSRGDVIEYLRRHPVTNAFKRALTDPKAQIDFLGGFTPAGELPYWAVKVTSRHGRVWNVRLIADEPRGLYRVARQP